MGGISSLVEEEVRDRVADGIRYAGWLLDRVDPTHRLRRVALACRLDGIGYLPWRTRAEVAASPNAASMSLSGLESAASHRWSCLELPFCSKRQNRRRTSPCGFAVKQRDSTKGPSRRLTSA
jgi:hypothetical protein